MSVTLCSRLVDDAVTEPQPHRGIFHPSLFTYYSNDSSVKIDINVCINNKRNSGLVISFLY